MDYRRNYLQRLLIVNEEELSGKPDMYGYYDISVLFLQLVRDNTPAVWCADWLPKNTKYISASNYYPNYKAIDYVFYIFHKGLIWIYPGIWQSSPYCLL